MIGQLEATVRTFMLPVHLIGVALARLGTTQASGKQRACIAGIGEI
jgi:hypothetical protein